MLLIIQKALSGWRLWCSPYCTEQSPRHLRRRKPGNEAASARGPRGEKGIPALVVKRHYRATGAKKVKQEHVARQDHTRETGKRGPGTGTKGTTGPAQQVHRDKGAGETGARGPEEAQKGETGEPGRSQGSRANRSGTQGLKGEKE